MRELVVKIAIKLGVYHKLMKIDNKVQLWKQNKAFSEYGVKTLEIATNVARKEGCTLFLTFGTLLGAYRNKGFIPSDYDLDTGMLGSERTDDFIRAMESSGVKHIREYYVKDTGRICEDKFNYKGVNIDVHYYYKNEEGNLFCELCLPHETKDWRSANASDGFPSILRVCPETTFSEYDFLGIKCFIPNSTHSWLSALYGEDFMTPNPKWTMEDHKKLSKCNGERLLRKEYR